MLPPFVDQTWLAAHPEAVVADVRWYADARSGANAYAEGHLPGAVFVDLDRWLATPPSAAEGRHPLPDPEVFAQGMRAAGIGDGTTVVAYDDDAGACAARLVWMLRVTGHDAALLDGGITAWQGELTQEVPTPAPAVFSGRPWPQDALATMAEVAERSDLLLLDARPGERFRGAVEPIDARPGHVPGAVSVPCRQNVGPQGLLLPDEQLRRRFAAVDGPWVSSCGSGVTACQNLLVAEKLGLPPGRLWPGSYSQWAATDLQVDTGP